MSHEKVLDNYLVGTYYLFVEIRIGLPILHHVVQLLMS